MRLVAILAAVPVLAACDDDLPSCGPPSGPLPTGVLSSPYALPMPDDCQPCGADRLVGRWFLADRSQEFYYAYPAFEDSGRGVLRSSGGRLFGWSDGSVVFRRTEYSKTAVEAVAYCLRYDDTLGGADVVVGDTESFVTHFTGTRFAPRDALAQGLELVGTLGRGFAGAIQGLDLAVDGGFAYVVGPNGLDIVDVRDPAAPAEISHISLGRSSGFNDVVIVHGDGKTAAYLSPVGDPPTSVVDVTDPRNPSIAAAIPDYSHTLFHTGSRLYLATYTNDIPIFDVSHPLAPVRIGATTAPGANAGIHDMFVDGDRIYANNTTAGLIAFDVSGGLDHPVALGGIATSYSHTNVVGTVGGRRVVLHGDEGMTGTPDGAAFLRILDGDPSSRAFLTEIARYQSRPEVGIHNFQLVGDRLYIAYYQDGVRVLDLANPARPREVAHFNTWDPTIAPGSTFEGALGLQVVGDLIYVADILRGLVILRDPALARYAAAAAGSNGSTSTNDAPWPRPLDSAVTLPLSSSAAHAL